ncbi:MAG: hypothetical protein L0Z62_50720 [Gemmataceae bacterium]|nr:hypothetical protein [Gemmataceae bacterium]
MHVLRSTGAVGLGGLAILLLAQGMAHTQDKPGVELRVVKYAGLAEEIHKHLGKVIVVDFWADY